MLFLLINILLFFFEYYCISQIVKRKQKKINKKRKKNKNYILATKSTMLRKRNIMLCVVLSIHLIIVLGFRYYLVGGIDMYRYNLMYEDVSRMSLADAFMYTGGKEGFFFVTYKFFTVLGLSFQSFVFFSSCFCVITFSIYVFKNCKNPFYAYLVFLGFGPFVFNFYLLRQMIAGGFVLIALMFHFKGKIIKSIFFTFIAFMFHSTAIVLLLYFAISRIKVTKAVFATFLIVIGIMFIFRMQIGELLTSVLRADYVGFYQNQNSHNSSFFLYLAFTILLLFCKFDRKNELLMGMMLMVLIQLFSAYSYSFTRLNIYFVQGIFAISVEKPIHFIKNKKNMFIPSRVYAMSLTILCIFLYFYSSFGQEIDKYIFAWGC